LSQVREKEIEKRGRRIREKRGKWGREKRKGKATGNIYSHLFTSLGREELYMYFCHCDL
jgi:hypothetical protein